MKISHNTILITGGGSGIGFETARLLSELDNTIILVGRNKEKLEAAAGKLRNVHVVVADVTREQDVDALVHTIHKNFPRLNVLMNNAGHAVIHDVSKSLNGATIAREEMETNYFAVLSLTNKLIPLLKSQNESAIINVSSVVAFAPGLALPTYSASKAALHSYTQALRLSLKRDSNVKVFELMPPFVDTEFAKDFHSVQKISPEEVAIALLQSLAIDRYEVPVASAEHLYNTFLSQADKAVLALNGLELN
jgi:uncharacterized oxidoreductase